MEEVGRNLYIGDRDEWVRGRPDWAVIHAEKGLHRKYLEMHRLLYRDAVPSPDGKELFLAFEDGLKGDRVNTRCIIPALGFIHRHLSAGRKVLIHCMAGVSRAPAIAMLYLLEFTDLLPRSNIFDAIFSFSRIYPLYDPNDGLLPYAAGFLEEMKRTGEPGVKRGIPGY